MTFNEHMRRTLDPEEMAFGKLLATYRERMKISRNRLAINIGVNPSYLTRVENGERAAPRQYIVLALAKALRLSQLEMDRFLVAGGYAPNSLVVTGQWDPIMTNVAEVLADQELSAADKDRFREVIRALTNHWRGPSDDLVPRMTGWSSVTTGVSAFPVASR